ncbi:MAG: hypothetical protein U0401_04405 [Anaerolineae bacterium]
MVITSVLNVANVLGFDLIGHSILVPMGVMLAFGILGAVDDLMGVRVISTGLLGALQIFVADPFCAGYSHCAALCA